MSAVRGQAATGNAKLCLDCLGTMKADTGETAPTNADMAQPVASDLTLATEPVGSGAEPVRPRVGDYELQEHLAKGGMGLIYKVQDARLSRTLALKVMAIDPALTAEADAFPCPLCGRGAGNRAVGPPKCGAGA
jgi:hypothetical protein